MERRNTFFIFSMLQLRGQTKNVWLGLHCKIWGRVGRSDFFYFSYLFFRFSFVISGKNCHYFILHEFSTQICPKSTTFYCIHVTSANLTIFYNIIFYLNDRSNNFHSHHFSKNMYVFMNDSNKKIRVGGFCHRKSGTVG